MIAEAGGRREIQRCGRRADTRDRLGGAAGKVESLGLRVERRTSAACLRFGLSTLNAELSTARRRALVADDFYEDSFAAAAVEFAVEDLFPRAEIEFAAGDGDDDLAAHDGAFEVGVGVVLAGAIVVVGVVRFLGRELFKPALVVAVEAGLVVVDEDGRGYVRCPFATGRA